MNIKEIIKSFGFLTKQDEIRLYWWRGVNGKNFGDLIGPYLVEKISGKKPIWVNRYCLTEHYITVGSIANKSNKNTIIWGSGLISEKKIVKKPKKIYAIRGQETRKVLLKKGIECPKVFGDPAILLPLYYKPKSKKRYELGIIPHYIDYKEIKERNLDKSIRIINVLNPVEKVIDEIFSCKNIMSSSLHGLIVAETYLIPSILVKFSDKLLGDGIKFKDYFLSVRKKPYKPYNFIKRNIDKQKIIKLIKKKNKEKIQFEREKLLESCPFRN